MIEQLFYVNDVEILRLYHNGFNDYSKEREIVRNRRYLEYDLRFTERWINARDKEITYDNLLYGFLSCNEMKNPYSHICCEYKEFVKYEEDINSIEEYINEHHRVFIEICNFVKEWSSYDLKNSPLSINNTILFTPTKIEVIFKKREGKILCGRIKYNKYDQLVCIVKFKRNSIIVDTKIIQIDELDFFVEPKQNWSTVDIEMFSKEQIVYAYYELSFIESLNLNIGIVTSQVKVDLKNSNRKVNLRNVESEVLNVGHSTDDEKLIHYQYQEQILKEQLNNTKNFTFLSKGKYDEGLNIFEEIAGTEGYQELWIFDPYFITYETKGGKSKLNDIITILGKNLSLKKIIVFESKENDTELFTAFKGALQDNIDYLKKREVNLSFSFIGTKEHFHDRFIFLKNETKLKAFSLGTSFNSFGDNYSAIIELDQSNGRLVFDELISKVVNQENIVICEDLK